MVRKFVDPNITKYRSITLFGAQKTSNDKKKLRRILGTSKSLYILAGFSLLVYNKKFVNDPGRKLRCNSLEYN